MTAPNIILARDGDATESGGWLNAPRRILLVDCDAFFVQVARLEDPEGAGLARHLLVGGTGSRGVVASASYSARRRGVQSGMAVSRATRLCPEAMLAPVPRRACGRKSREVRKALEELAPIIQAASIDEFYLDLSGTERMLKGELLDRTATRIRERVLEQAGIQVSIGGGAGRVVAKMAVQRAKPCGVHIVAPGAEREFMAGFALRQVHGIGPALAQRLEKRGLRSVRDAQAIGLQWLATWFGQRTGRWLWERIRGIDATRSPARVARRSISAEGTFSRDTSDQELLAGKLQELCGRVCRRLRGKGLRARTVTVKVRDADFRTRSRRRTVVQALESTSGIFRVARKLLLELCAQRRVPARLVGIALGNMEPNPRFSQTELFPDALDCQPPPHLETERERELFRTLDRLRKRFGETSIQMGRTMPRERRS